MERRATVGLVIVVIVMVTAPARGQLDGDMAELAKALREGCVAETEVDTSLLDAVNGGADLPADPKLKCYIKCTMETAGMMTDGEIELEALLAILPEEFRARNEANFRKCGTQKGADDCDTAFKTQQCWQNSNKKDYFLI